MGEQVDGTIEERNLQSFLKACVIYTLMTPALEKWVTNSATWIINLKNYKNEIVCIIEYRLQRLSASSILFMKYYNNHNSYFIQQCSAIVSYLNDWHKTLTWALTTLHKLEWSLKTSSNALLTIEQSTHISTVPCPPVIIGHQQGPMHSHLHLIMTSPWLYSRHVLLHAA